MAIALETAESGPGVFNQRQLIQVKHRDRIRMVHRVVHRLDVRGRHAIRVHGQVPVHDQVITQPDSAVRVDTGLMNKGFKLHQEQAGTVGGPDVLRAGQQARARAATSR